MCTIRPFGAFAARSARCGAAQDCLHPRGYLARGKRLYHVIVGAHFNADHAIDLLIAG
ncbi:hypothetical protein [Croceicoccus sp. YJ47]|uniref:hypothetical protein n=1 Tax=Croceicoccus sp. YJ47 TaxID=2798724 RepID=UPI001F2FB29D|nr:hypothetical protein [Croceicoccus sp. YJ47]